MHLLMQPCTSIIFRASQSRQVLYTVCVVAPAISAVCRCSQMALGRTVAACWHAGPSRCCPARSGTGLCRTAPTLQHSSRSRVSHDDAPNGHSANAQQPAPNPGSCHAMQQRVPCLWLAGTDLVCRQRIMGDELLHGHVRHTEMALPSRVGPVETLKWYIMQRCAADTCQNCSQLSTYISLSRCGQCATRAMHVSSLGWSSVSCGWYVMAVIVSRCTLCGFTDMRCSTCTDVVPPPIGVAAGRVLVQGRLRCTGGAPAACTAPSPTTAPAPAGGRQGPAAA